MSSVWAVTSGSYEDYRVDHMYVTEAQATEAVRLLNQNNTRFDEYYVEQFELHDHLPTAWPSYTLMSRFIRTPAEEQKHKTHWHLYSERPKPKVSDLKVKVTKNRGGIFQYGLCLEVEGSNMDEVRKAYEHRLQQLYDGHPLWKAAQPIEQHGAK